MQSQFSLMMASEAYLDLHHCAPSYYQGSGFKKITEAYYDVHSYCAELEPKFYSDVTSFQVTLFDTPHVGSRGFSSP